MINVNLLPKTLQRQREPGYWRLIAVAFPVLALAALGFIQFSALQTEKRLLEVQAERVVQLSLLQKFVDEQHNLQARQRDLNELIAVANAVREGRIVWSEQLFAMLETLPGGDALDSRIAFKQLDMRALDENTKLTLLSDNTYEGLEVIAEMDVQGTAGSTEVLADYLRELQVSPLFGVSFRDVSRDGDAGLYTFSLTVGAADVSPDADPAETAQAAETGVAQ